jgi:tetratricopeptide (TPR) repeat protein
LGVGVVAIGLGLPALASALEMPYEAQRRFLLQELPAELGQGPVRSRGPAPARPLRVRFFADREFRASAVRWEEKARALLARLNAFTQPTFGVTLEAAGFLKWERAGSADDLEVVLRELVRTDAGEGADVVVGLVAPLTLFATSQHQMGEAEVGGKHLVLRGMTDVTEAQGFRRAFDVLDPKELEPIIRARVQHREAGVFLHELGHCLGLLHEAGSEGLLSPTYRRQQAAFSADSASFMATALGFRLQDRPDPVAEARALLQVVEAGKAATWPAVDRKQMTARLQAIASQAGGGGAAGVGASEGGRVGPAGPAGTAASEEAALLVKAEEQARAKDRAAMLATARAVRARLLEAGPGPAEEPAGTREARPEALTGAAEGMDLPRALRPALRPALGVGPPPPPPSVPRATPLPKAQQEILWARLARLFAFGSALAHAEEALERAGTADPAADELRIELSHTRRRIGLPPGGAGLAPDDEPAYAELFWDLSERIGRGAGAARVGEGIGRELAARYPDVPGAIALRCEAELRAGRTAAGLRLCKEALRLYPETSRALFFLATVDAQSGRRPAAIAGLRKLIELDPDLQGAWHTLAETLRASRRAGELKEVSERYRARFGAALDVRK